MNEPTQISLANSLTIKQSTSNAGQQSVNLNGETLNAKNITFAKGSVQMDILVNDHWQTLRLATSQSPSNMQKIPAAEIQLSTDGKQLTILPTQTSLALNQAKQLQSLLNFIHSGSQLSNQPFAVTVATKPTPKIQIAQLNASLPINTEVAQLLQSEQPLKAIINMDQKGLLKLVVINRFADNLHQQPITKAKLATWLAKLAPQGQLQRTNNAAQLTIPQQKSAFNIPIKHTQAQQLSAEPQAVKIIATKDQLTLKTLTNEVAVVLKNSLTQTFHNLVKAQQSTAITKITTDDVKPVQSPLINASSPIKSWLQASFADLKTRVNDAVRYFENKPFNQLTDKNDNPLKAPISSTSNEKAPQQLSLIPKSVSQINLAALARENVAPLLADISKGTALPKHFHSAPPLVQLFQQVKATLASITTPTAAPVVSNNNLSISSGKASITQAEIATKADTAKTPAVDKQISFSTTEKETAKTHSTINKDITNTNTAKVDSQFTNQKNSSTINSPLIAKNSNAPLIEIKNPNTVSQSVSETANKLKQVSTINKELASNPSLTKDKDKVSIHFSSVNETSKTQKLASIPPTLMVQTQKENIKAPLTATPVRSQVSLPIEAKLTAPLLNIAKPQLQSSSNAATGSESNSTKVDLSQKIEQLAQGKVSDNVDLNRLVNQAFNRMINSQSAHPSIVQREILSLISPNSLSTSAMQQSFSQAIENLSVAILAAPALNNISALNFTGQSSVDALLQVLVPNFKAVNSEKLQEQLQQASSQTLAAELGQIKSNISQVASTAVNQQTDSNALVQFFLPMRLPPDAAQTEISLGQYKKPSKDKPEGKDVWFVRLNFDYAALGQLQITAELMDKALDCKLLASSQEVTAIAHPHLESLRHKLSAHGLQVGELNLSQGAPQHQAFYQSHAIINIKV